MFANPRIERIFRLWIAQIGDDTILPWVTTILYACAFIAAIANLKRLKFSEIRDEYKFWLLLACLLFLMGANKQLDFHYLLRDIGRYMAHLGGWFEKARTVQALFTFVVIGVVGIGALLALPIIMKSWRSNVMAVAGAATICFYIVIRTAAINHVITYKFDYETADLKSSDAVEAIGVALILIGAVKRHRSEKSREISPGKKS
jgi:hypothetical protein